MERVSDLPAVVFGEDACRLEDVGEARRVLWLEEFISTENLETLKPGLQGDLHIRLPFYCWVFSLKFTGFSRRLKAFAPQGD